MIAFPSAPNHVRTRHKASVSERKSTFFLRGRTQLWLFSNLPKSSAHASGAWHHSHPRSHPLSVIFFLTSVNDTSSPHARQHLRSSLQFTNPCAKRKVLSLTKPKGRIYKTKSLDHYITSRTLLSILADLNNAVVWMVSTHLLISKSSCPCTQPLVIVPSAQITNGITVTFMFLSFFSSLARSRYLSLFSLSISFTLGTTGTAKSTIQ